jgi:fluoride exporter
VTPSPFDPDVADDEDLARPATSPFARVRGGRWRGFAARLPVVLAVAGGGALGGCARYGIERLLPTGTADFPWPTFLANVVGSFCLALLLVLILDVWPPTRYVRPFLAVGLLGSFTTFSTWMVEFDQLLTHGAPTVAAAYLATSVLAGVAAASLGLVIGRGVAARRTSTSSKGRR